MNRFSELQTMFDNSIEVFFRDVFNNTDKVFQSIIDNSCKLSYPIDIYSVKEGIGIEIAAIGADKNDITIEVDNDILTVAFKRPDEDYEKLEMLRRDGCYYKQGITKRSFKFAWKISKGDLDKIDVSLERGLLKIFIPWKQEDKKIKTIKIN